MSHQVTREISFDFKGKSYTFAPDMKLLRRLHGVCIDGRTTLVELATSIANRKPDIFTLSYILQQLLQASDGSKFTEDECYAWVSTGGEGKATEIATFFAAVLNTVFPEVDLGKKPEGQDRPSPNPKALSTGKKTKTR